METKFHLLSIGQHFEWEGTSYVKTTTLLANQIPDGGQKFMPKAAMVKLLGQQAAAPAAATAAPLQLDSRQVRDAVQRYHQRCMAISGHPQSDEEIIEEVRNELEQVYRDLLTELKL